MDELERRREANALLDKQAEETVLQVEKTVAAKLDQFTSELQVKSLHASTADPVISTSLGEAAGDAGVHCDTMDVQSLHEARSILDELRCSESVASGLESNTPQEQEASTAASGSDTLAPTVGAVGEAEPALAQGVSTTATMRYQAARLQVLQEEVDKLRGLLAEKNEAAAVAERRAREEEQQRIKHERAEKQLRAAVEREKAAAAEQRARVESLERDIAHERKDAEEAARSKQAASGEQRSKDVRLNRALEELERYRSQLRELREDRDGAGQGAHAEAQRLAAENTKLRKRQSELLLAFKKQAKLIDVLKRQKLHAEAACMLGFTEEEFMRTLELGEQKS